MAPCAKPLFLPRLALLVVRIGRPGLYGLLRGVDRRSGHLSNPHCWEGVIYSNIENSASTASQHREPARVRARRGIGVRPLSLRYSQTRSTTQPLGSIWNESSSLAPARQNVCRASKSFSSCPRGAICSESESCCSCLRWKADSH